MNKRGGKQVIGTEKERGSRQGREGELQGKVVVVRVQESDDLAPEGRSTHMILFSKYCIILF